MEHLKTLNPIELTSVNGGRISGLSLPSFWSAIAIASAFRSYYQGLAEGCKCALENNE